MAATYTIARGDARSRVRLAIGDTDVDTASFSDADIDGTLRDTASSDFLQVYFDDTTAGVSAATVQVRLGANAVELVLQRTTIPSEVATVIKLSNNRDYDKITDLIDAVHELGKGWQLALATQAEGEVVELDPGYWSEPRYRVALGRPSADLETTDALDVYGFAKAKRLALWSPAAAAASLRRVQALDMSQEQSRREGNISFTRTNPNAALAAGSMPRARGVFTRPL